MQIEQTFSRFNRLIQLGTYGHLAVFVWLLSMVMVLPHEHILLTAGICLPVIAGIYPDVLRRCFNWKLIVLGTLMVLPPVFFLGEADQTFFGLPYATEGLMIGLYAGLRFWVIVLAVYGFTQSVDIPSLAGILERFGLQGLGFSIGVALNLLPSLKDAAMKSWYSFKMRGGFRKQWFRGLQLYLVVVITNALRQAEDISLAAEARAFSPEKSRPMKITYCKLDWLIYPLCLASLILTLIWK